jgi:hypothetical protein
MSTLVSRNTSESVAGIRIIPLKLEVSWQLSSKLPQSLKQGLMTGFFSQLESALASHQYLYVVTFVKL